MGCAFFITIFINNCCRFLTSIAMQETTFSESDNDNNKTDERSRKPRSYLEQPALITAEI